MPAAVHDIGDPFGDVFGGRRGLPDGAAPPRPSMDAPAMPARGVGQLTAALLGADGLQAGELALITGLQAAGKTSLSAALCAELVESDRTVLHWSLDNMPDLISDRLATQAADPAAVPSRVDVVDGTGMPFAAIVDAADGYDAVIIDTLQLALRDEQGGVAASAGAHMALLRAVARQQAAFIVTYDIPRTSLLSTTPSIDRVPHRLRMGAHHYITVTGIPDQGGAFGVAATSRAVKAQVRKAALQVLPGGRVEMR